MTTPRQELMIHQSSELMPVQADSDETMLSLWLHGLSDRTVSAYEADARSFLTFAGKELRFITVRDIQAFEKSMASLKPASIARKLSSVKSLLTHAHRLGYVAFNAGAAVRLPRLKDTLAEKIIGERDIQRMLALEPDPRNAAILTLTYAAGLRVSEVAALKWRNASQRGDAGQVTVYGKGGKTRAILLPASVWCTLLSLRGTAEVDMPIFVSRSKGGNLDRTQLHRIVKAAAKRAGLSDEVSAHWLRHAHVSHALDRGAPAHLVQATVGHASLATTSRYAHARPNDSSARYLAV